MLCSEDDSEDEHEILGTNDSGSEYVADPSELELDDDDYRPAKRTRSLSCFTRAELSTSLVATVRVRRKGVSSKFVSRKNGPKRKESSACVRKKKPGTMPEAPRPACVWCDKEFTRSSDVLRHEQTSCKLYPFDRTLEYCPLCDKEISRNDAVIWHQDSVKCRKRQRKLRKLREQGILPAKVVNKEMAASAGLAREAAKAAQSPRRAASA